MLLLLMRMPSMFPNSIMADTKKLLNLDLSLMSNPNWRELPEVIDAYENLIAEIVDFTNNDEDSLY